jgi:hypothetical protein
MGFRETEWNIGCGDGQTAGVFESATARLEFGPAKSVSVSGTGQYSVGLSAGGLRAPTGVFPLDWRRSPGWTIRRGGPGAAYLADVNAIVWSCRPAKGGGLRAELSSFDGHRVRARIVGRSTPAGAFIDGRRVENMKSEKTSDGAVITTLVFPGTLRKQILEVRRYR